MDKFGLNPDEIINENEIDADEYIDPEVEEKFQRALEIARYINSKPKLRVSDAKVMQRFNKVVTDLAYLLEENGFEYCMETDVVDDIISVDVTIECFDVCFNDHKKFKNIISNTDGFSVVDLATDGVRMSFSINSAFKKIKPKPKH